MDDDTIKKLVEERRKAEQASASDSSIPTDSASLGATSPASGEITRKFVRDCLHANQLGDGMLYAALHDGRYLQNKRTGEFYRWAGHYWELDFMERSLADVEIVAGRYMQESRDLVGDIDWAMKKKDREAAEGHKKTQEAIYKRVSRLRTENGRKNCRSFAVVNMDHPLAITGDELDADPWLLACENGVVDLRTGELRAGRCKDYLSKASPHDYPGIDAEPSLWNQTVLDIFDGNQDLVDYMQRLLGYGITGLKREAVLPILWGQGRNGKTLMVETVSHVLGPLAAPIQSEMLLDQGRSKSASSASPDIMALKGLRLAFGSEADEGRRFSPAKVKWLSGSDTLVGRSLYDRYDTYFTPTHTLILLTNHKPHAPANDFAFWARVHLVPFLLSFVEHPKKDNERLVDKTLGEALKKEAPAILSWLVRGCLRWQRDGLAPPAVIVEATEEYKRDEDLLADFIDQRCFLGEGLEVPATDLYDAFKEWFSENVSKRGGFSQKRFGNLIKDRFDKVKRGTYFYQGLRLMSR